MTNRYIGDARISERKLKELAFVRNSSVSTSRNPNGTGIIASIIYTSFSSKTFARNRSNLGKTLYI